MRVMSTENLRREARVDVRIPVVIYRGKKPVEVETSDVSFKGLFVCTVDPPPLMSLVRLEVFLFDRAIEVHAMAVHVVKEADATGEHAAGVGLQFWGLAGPNRTAWDDFVRGLVQARRAAAKPANADATPSGVRIVATTPHASSKS
jgi:PilZ domain